MNAFPVGVKTVLVDIYSNLKDPGGGKQFMGMKTAV